MYCKGKYYDL